MQATGDTRQRILDVAVELFAEVGYDKASIRELGARLGITSAALYYHFANKQEILTALTEDVLTSIDELADRAWTEPDPAARQRQVLGGFIDLVATHRSAMAVLESSLATLRTLDSGARAGHAMERLATLIAPAGDPGAHVRAVFALGMLTTAPARLPGPDGAAARPHLLAAALGALRYPVDVTEVESSATRSSEAER
ncbi:TetR/AcrR family transcriptional regulator [Pseudonocardia sp. GCM10023141]|uniref:TetR/AcrR family transcriptional regulator n=1 Tax=Pseudonocardia sp. GCM10023141 TaxID=3252653 RepID=UPI00361C6C75